LEYYAVSHLLTVVVAFFMLKQLDEFMDFSSWNLWQKYVITRGWYFVAYILRLCFTDDRCSLCSKQHKLEISLIFTIWLRCSLGYIGLLIMVCTWS